MSFIDPVYLPYLLMLKRKKAILVMTWFKSRGCDQSSFGLGLGAGSWLELQTESVWRRGPRIDGSSLLGR